MYRLPIIALFIFTGCITEDPESLADAKMVEIGVGYIDFSHTDSSIDFTIDSGLADSFIDARSIDTRQGNHRCEGVVDIDEWFLFDTNGFGPVFNGNVQVAPARLASDRVTFTLTAINANGEQLIINLPIAYQNLLVAGEILQLDVAVEIPWWLEGLFVLTDPETHQIRAAGFQGDNTWLDHDILMHHALSVSLGAGCSPRTPPCYRSVVDHPLLVEIADQESTVFPGETTGLIIDAVNYDFVVKSSFTQGEPACTDIPISVIKWTLLPRL